MDSKVKQRLAGTVVLSILAVIFLPLLFRSGNIALDLPKAPPMPSPPQVSPERAILQAQNQTMQQQHIVLQQREQQLDQQRSGVISLAKAKQHKHIQKKTHKHNSPQFSFEGLPSKKTVSHAKSKPQSLAKNNPSQKSQKISAHYFIQLASFRDKNNAAKLVKSVKLLNLGKKAAKVPYGLTIKSSPSHHHKYTYRVVLGPLRSLAKAKKIAKQLTKQHHLTPWILKNSTQKRAS